MDDRLQELQDHIRELARDRDEILEEKRRIASWVIEHGRHGVECGEDFCTCGLEEMRKKIRL